MPILCGRVEQLGQGPQLLSLSFLFSSLPFTPHSDTHFPQATPILTGSHHVVVSLFWLLTSNRKVFRCCALLLQKPSCPSPLLLRRCRELPLPDLNFAVNSCFRNNRILDRDHCRLRPFLNALLCHGVSVAAPVCPGPRYRYHHLIWIPCTCSRSVTRQ